MSNNPLRQIAELVEKMEKHCARGWADRQLDHTTKLKELVDKLHAIVSHDPQVDLVQLAKDIQEYHKSKNILANHEHGYSH